MSFDFDLCVCRGRTGRGYQVEARARVPARVFTLGLPSLPLLPI